MLKLFGILLLLGYCLFAWGCATDQKPAEELLAEQRPNIIFILTDDLGYADLGCYGSTKIKTPHLDRIASEGLKLTNFYAFPSCSPSRAALLTGCYPPRVGIPDVVGPPGPDWTANKQYGLHPREYTIPELLQEAGYTTAMIGKWHLGHFPETSPLEHGFQSFFGLPYSNDMIPLEGNKWPDLPLIQDRDTLEFNPDQRQLTQRYTEHATAFIEQEEHDQPFFLYLAHAMPHTPLFTSEAFSGRSGQGIYADVVEEIDASVGAILTSLEETGQAENTLLIFTSDNGPWLTFGNHAGSAGPFREGKGTTFEGGMRVPFLAYWPARINPAQSSHTVASLIDILPTVSALAEADLPSTKIDGRDLSLLLLNNEELLERPFHYWCSGNLDAIRLGPWKLHLPHSYRYVTDLGNDGVRGDYSYEGAIDWSLYHLTDDPGEQYNLVDQEPEKAAELRRLAEEFMEVMEIEKREPFRAN
ncbi:MAG: sulfatase [Bacteroidota bacterium]